MKPKFIDHIVIIVKDIEKTTEFYSKFLGEPITKDKNQVAYQIGEIKLFFGLAYKDYEWYDKDRYGLNHLAFGVKSIEELKELDKKLNNGGIKNSGIVISKYSGKKYIWFDDLDGYRLEFYFR